MEVRLPATLLGQIVGHPFTNQDVAGVSALHYSLRDIDAYTGDVCAVVSILHVMDRAAMNSHSHRQTGLRSQRMADLKRAFGGIFHRSGKRQRHPVASR